MATKKKLKKPLTISQRWEQGTPHHPRSEAAARKIAKIDRGLGNDRLDLRFGGDGDNGEHLIYLLDVFFETEEGL